MGHNVWKGEESGVLCLFCLNCNARQCKRPRSPVEGSLAAGGGKGGTSYAQGRGSQIPANLSHRTCLNGKEPSLTVEWPSACVIRVLLSIEPCTAEPHSQRGDAAGKMRVRKGRNVTQGESGGGGRSEKEWETGNTAVMRGGRGGTRRRRWQSALEQEEGGGRGRREKLPPPEHDTPCAAGRLLKGPTVARSDIKGGDEGYLEWWGAWGRGRKVLSPSVKGLFFFLRLCFPLEESVIKHLY